MVGGKSKNPKKANSAASDTLATALKRFKQSWDYAESNWHTKWDRGIKLYDNERVHATYEGTTDTFVPMTFSTIETMVAALSNASPRFEYKSGNPMTQSDDKALNALVDEWWDEDQWDLAIEEGERETLITGMCGFMFSWDMDRPHLDSYAMRDMIVDPTIRNPWQLQQPGAYAGRRYFVRKGSLDDVKVVDTDPEGDTYGEMVPRYAKAANDAPAGPQGDPDDKEIKEMFTGSTLASAKEDQDEIIEIWDVDRVVTVRNRRQVIEDVVNPFKHKHELRLLRKYTEQGLKDAASRAKSEAKGIVPFFFFRNYRKLSLFYASSEIESIAKSQELLNDMTNMETDYIIKQLAPQKELDPKYADWIDLITSDPDVVYPFEPGSLQDRPVPVLPNNSFNNRMNIKNEIRETTAIDQVAKGVQNVKQTTATEVQAQLNQSGQRIQSKARILEKDGFYWMGWILMKMIQLYVDEPIVVEIPGGSPQTPEEVMKLYGIELPKGTGVFDPADFAEDFKVRVTLDVDSQNTKLENQESISRAYQILIQDPTNNLEEIKRRLLPKMVDIDQADLDAIMTPNPQQAMAGGMVDPALQGAQMDAPAPEVPSGL